MSETNGKCSVSGCINHVTDTFTCHENGDVNLPKFTYTFTAHFKSTSEMLECAAKEVARRCQQNGRKGKFPSDRTVDVNAKGQYELTIADRKAAFMKLSPEQRAVELELLKELLATASKSK